MYFTIQEKSTHPEILKLALFSLSLSAEHPNFKSQHGSFQLTSASRCNKIKVRSSFMLLVQNICVLSQKQSLHMS